MTADFSESQIHRYARHIVLPEVGGVGQAKLMAAKVLVVGAGGLGSPVMLYLAAAGVGTIAVVDDDVVSLSNLQRQILFRQTGLGAAKAEAARDAVAALNPEVRVLAHTLRLDSGNAAALIADYPLIADCSDTIETRLLINDTARAAGHTVVSAAVLRFEGQLSTFKPGGPCYRCLIPVPPAATPSCAQAGVLGAMAGVIGSLQALELIKEILGIGDSLSGALLLVDGLAGQTRRLTLRRDPACPCCALENRAGG